jgi:hypothetical protein
MPFSNSFRVPAFTRGIRSRQALSLSDRNGPGILTGEPATTKLRRGRIASRCRRTPVTQFAWTPNWDLDFRTTRAGENPEPNENTSYHRRGGIILRREVSKLHNGERFSVAGCEQHDAAQLSAHRPEYHHCDGRHSWQHQRHQNMSHGVTK